jgi:hypothetical protein
MGPDLPALTAVVVNDGIRTGGRKEPAWLAANGTKTWGHMIDNERSASSSVPSVKIRQFTSYGPLLRTPRTDAASALSGDQSLQLLVAQFHMVEVGEEAAHVGIKLRVERSFRQHVREPHQSRQAVD